MRFVLEDNIHTHYQSHTFSTRCMVLKPDPINQGINIH